LSAVERGIKKDGQRRHVHPAGRPEIDIRICAAQDRFAGMLQPTVDLA